MNDGITGNVVQLTDLTKTLYESNEMAYTNTMLNEVADTYMKYQKYTNVDYKGYVTQVKLAGSNSWKTYVNEIEQVQENETPLANKVGSSWALINLICSILTVLTAIILLFSNCKKTNEDDEQDELQKRRVWLRIVSIAIAFISIVVFILIENVFNPMILVDRWTLTMVIIFFAQIVTFIIARKWKDVEQEENKEPEPV